MSLYERNLPHHWVKGNTKPDNTGEPIEFCAVCGAEKGDVAGLWCYDDVYERGTHDLEDDHE